MVDVPEISIYDQNAYGKMREVLKALGITATTKQDYNTKFGIAVKPPTPKEINPSHLMADGGSVPASSPQALAEQLRTDFDIQPGETDMLIMDMPGMAPQDAPVLIQVASADISKRPKSGSDSVYGTMGVCTVSPTLARMELGGNSLFSEGKTIYPQDSAGQIFPEARFDGELQAAIEAARVQIVQQPQHGEVVLKDGFDFKYLPKDNYIGNDKVVFLVDIGGKKVKVIYFIKVVDVSTHTDKEYENYKKIYKQYCPKGDWRISSTDGNADLLRTELGQLGANFGQVSNISVTFANLPNGALGQTTAQSITLDPTAASHGWFIDYTPYLNEEFLPTSNPYEWQARPGSAADGKMDMLTVLWHEYGHALGLEHTAAGHDLMSTTLTPGVRRLPTPEELAVLNPPQSPFVKGGGEGGSPGMPLAPFAGLPLLFTRAAQGSASVT